MLTIVQVLLISDSKVSGELERSLIAALKEVESFYNYDKERAVFERKVLSTDMVETSDGGLLPDLRRGFHALERLLESARGTFLGTYDQQKLVDLVRHELGPSHKDDRLVVLTDAEITPPTNWRYIIWETLGNGSVISLAPIDPLYWRQDDQNRIATIKHRARTACLSVVGSYLGFRECKNERCFYYENVDSIIRLDDMIELGPEHRLKELAKRGFAVSPSDPTKVQKVVYDPEPQESNRK